MSLVNPATLMDVNISKRCTNCCFKKLLLTLSKIYLLDIRILISSRYKNLEGAVLNVSHRLIWGAFKKH